MGVEAMLRIKLHGVIVMVLSAACVPASAVEANGAANDPAADRAQQIDDMTCKVMVVPQDPQEAAKNVVVGTGKRAWDVIKNTARKVASGEQTDVDAKTGKQELTATYRAELKRGNWLPMSTEVEYGRRSHELLVDTLLARESKLGQQLYARADALLDEIKRGVDKPHEYDFKLFIREESTSNAMALPGGFLYLDVGLLKDTKQYDKARFALAHEVGHVLQRHETRELQALIVDSYEDGDELRNAIESARRGSDQAQTLLKHLKISKDSYVRHSMDQELQADACAVRLIFNAYPGGKELAASTTAFISSLQRAKTAPAKTSPEPTPQFPAVVRELVTLPADRHPTSAERTKHLRDVQASLGTPSGKESG